MRAKSTLQLRHQLTCNGITIQAAAYDTRRHHVLTADAPAKGLPTPPMLRLFSLRRELKCVPLLGDAFPPVKKSSSTPQITIVMLEYTPSLDIFMCVYVVEDVYTIVFLETVSLRQLVSFPGPKTHLLRCVHYDDASARVLLAVRIRRLQSDGSPEKVPNAAIRSTSSARLLTDHLEFLQLSKRSFQAAHDHENPKQRVMLCVEKYRSPVLHPDSLTHVVGSANFRRVYGAGATAGVPSAYDAHKAVSEVFVMEWEDTNGTLVLIRRAVLAGAPLITSLALSAFGDWLFTGHQNGQLKVWHVQSEGVGVAVGTSPYVLGSTPIETPVESASESENSIHKIVLQQTSTLESPLNETLLFTVDQALGSVKHWRFELLAPTPTNHSEYYLSPRLECMSVYEMPSTEPKTRKQQAVLTPISILSVKVDMGSFVENLVLLMRADVLNVLKVQCVLDILLSFPSSEDCFAIRRIDLDQDRPPRVLCLSGTQVSGVRLLSQNQSDDGPYYELVPPNISSVFQSSPCVSAIDCIDLNLTGTSLAIYGWSNGAVEIYGIPLNNRLALVCDSRVNESITAVCVTLSNSIGSPKQNRASSVHIHSQIDQHRVLVCAGTASGQILCSELVLPVDTSIQRVEQAKRCISHAHSSHVVQLCQLETDSGTTTSQKMLSLGSDGVVKLWAVPSMTMMMFVSAATGPAVPSSCMKSVLAVDASTYLAVGFEDGTLAVWCMHPRRLEFDPIPITARHERRISSICEVPTEHCSETTQFVTCSLDMTVILWKIGVDGVHEHRYFEIGAPVISVCIIDNRAVVALAHEICTFRMFNDTKHSQQREELILNNVPIEAVNKSESLLTHANEEVVATVEEFIESEPITEDHEITQKQSPVPSQSAKSFISIPSIQLQADQTLESDIGQTINRTQSASDGNSFPLASGESQLGTYLRSYMDQFAENGKMSISKLIQFTKVYHVPTGEQPRTTILKHLKRMDADSHELTLEICFEVCQAIYHSNSKSARLFARKQLNQKRRNARKQHEHEIAGRQPIVSYNSLGEKTISWETKRIDKSPNQIGTQNDVTRDVPVSSRYMLDPGQSNSNSEEGEAIVYSRANRKKSVADCIGQRSRDEYPDVDLLQRLSLSVLFREMWSKGTCWCNGNPIIYVTWEQEDNQSSASDSTCSTCRKKQHSVKLDKLTYRPHFSLRIILGIIAEVYDQLAAPSHNLLFARAEPNTDTRVSIHEALFHVLRQQYGMQHVVEIKLKLLFISMCHFVREIDAVAVFGELLGVFAPGRVDSIPSEMAALCVSCYTWFYSREMVINGDTMIGRQKESSQKLSNIPVVEIENGKRTNWQFVQLQHASLCAQEILLYPLVSPGYLQNILLYMGEYSQRLPNFPIVANSDDDRAFQSNHAPSGKRWIEIHRFLRLLVGEWKEQSEEFYSVEQALFVHPTIGGSDPLRAKVIEKLRLLLNCFIVYDHERLGVMEVGDFDLLLRKLRYLWPNEKLTLDEAAKSANANIHMSLTYENTILAAKLRFGDTEWDGRLCYLDFWAMLYIVGLKTNDLLKFREIPGFCRDYKLEIVPELRDMLTTYMERSSSLLLPAGSQAGQHTLDQFAMHQHRRRVGGLHDGMFVPMKTIRKSFSLQSIVPKCGDDELYLEGAIPVIRQSASTSAINRFQPVSHSSEIIEDEVATTTDFSKGPVVVGIRPKGSKNKQTTLLRVTSIGNGVGMDFQVKSNRDDEIGQQKTNQTQVLTVPNPELEKSDLASSVYIQFPNIAPQYKRMPLLRRKNGDCTQSGHLNSNDHQLSLYADEILHEHVKDEAEMAKRRLSTETLMTGPINIYGESRDIPRSKRQLLGNFTPHESLARIELEQKKPGPVQSIAPEKTSSPQVVSKKKAKSTEVVVVPTIEKNTVKASSAAVTGSLAVTRSHSGRDQLSKRVPATDSSQAKSPPTNLVREESFKLEKWQSEDIDDVANAQDMIVPPQITVAKEHVAEPIIRPTASILVKPKTLSEKLTTDPALHTSVAADLPDVSLEMPKPVIAIEIAQTIPEPVEFKPMNLEVTRHDSTHQSATVVKSNIPEVEVKKPKAESKPVKAVEVAVVEKQTPLVVEVKELGTQKDVLASDSTNKMKIPTEVSALQTNISIIEPKEMEFNPTLNSVTDELSNTAGVLHQSPKLDQHAHGVSAALELQPIAVSTELTPEKVIPVPTNKVLVEPSEHVVLSDGIPEAKPQAPGKLLPDIVSTESKTAQRHTFRFSQQPGFLLAVSSAKNRSVQPEFSYNDYDSESENESSIHGDLNSNEKPPFCFRGEEEDDGVPIEEMELVLSQSDRKSSLEPGARTKGAKVRSVPTARTSSGKHGKASRAMSRDLESVDESFESSNIDPDAIAASSSNRQKDRVERALYGEREENTLGEGIMFTADAEKEMAHKWEQFFENAEVAMFSPLAKELEEYQTAQRIAEEEQTKLMKKRLDQQAQDNLRLQQSRRSSSVFLEANDKKRSGSTSEDGAAFRLHRMARESCQQTQTELQYGMSVTGQCKQINGVEYFHFCYRPETDGSILTVKLHIKRGDAHAFLSTQTTVPCATDFMWRSSENVNEAHEGRKIILYPRELMKALAATNDVDCAQEASSMVIYLSVISSEPMTSFTLGVMTSGHRTEHSQAIRNVDSLIDRFSQLAKTFTGSHANAIAHSSSMSASCTFADTDEPTPFARRRETRHLDRINASPTSFDDSDSDDEIVYDGDSERMQEPNSELGSFQHLLESIRNIHGGDERKSTSFVLAGPSNDQYEFIHDEELKLAETTHSLSPVGKRNVAQKPLGFQQLEREEEDANVKAQVTLERRLARLRGSISSKAAKSMKKQRLSPLKGSILNRPLAIAAESTANVQVAKFAPKPVAYSLSTLPPPLRNSKKA